MASGDTLELLRSAQAALDADAAALEAQRVLLAAERESQEAEKSRMTRMAAATAESDVVPLNVGGLRVCAQRRVITAACDSLLGAMLSGRWDGSLARDADGVIFLDADPDSFAQLLAALRMRAAPAAAASNPPRGGCHPPLRRDLVALADEYLLRDYLWPAPAAGADVVQAGAAVCAVTVEREGRALRVRGGQQLPQPVTLQAPAPAAGFAFGAGAQPAPFGAFAAPAAAARAAPVFGAAGVPTPQSVVRQDLAEYVRLRGNLALGPWPAAYRVPWSALPAAVPFLNSEEDDNLNHDFAVGMPNRVNAQFDIINRGGKGQHGQGPQGPSDLIVPLSNYVLCSPPLLICSDAVNRASFVLSLRSLTGGAVVGVARDARCVYGLMLLRRLAPWHIPPNATLNGHPQSSRGTFLPVVNGTTGYGGTTPAKNASRQVAGGTPGCADQAGRPPRRAPGVSRACGARARRCAPALTRSPRFAA